MEQSKLSTALEGSLPQQFHCLHMPPLPPQPGWCLGRVGWSLTGNTGMGWRPPQSWCLRTMHSTDSHLHWSVVHKAFINFKRCHSWQPDDDSGGFMSSVDRQLCYEFESFWEDMLGLVRFHITWSFHSCFPRFPIPIHFAYLKFACKYICWYNAEVTKSTSQTHVCFNQHPCFIHSMSSSSWSKRGRLQPPP